MLCSICRLFLLPDHLHTTLYSAQGLRSSVAARPSPDSDALCFFPSLLCTPTIFDYFPYAKFFALNLE